MVAMFADKIMSACCGGNEMVNSMMTKMPWNKNKKDDGDDDVPEVQKNKRNDIKKTQTKKNGKFSAKDTKYENTKWKNLPVKVRKAVQELGADESKWDSSEHLDVSHKHWEDLTEDEKKSLEVLGWEEQAWESHYEHYDWAELPELQKKAATAAGFTQEKWDDDEWPENLDEHWDELKDEDKDAMAVLGYTKKEWDH